MEENIQSYNTEEERKVPAKDFKKIQFSLETPLYKEAAKKLIDEDKTWQDLLRASVIQYVKS